MIYVTIIWLTRIPKVMRITLRGTPQKVERLRRIPARLLPGTFYALLLRLEKVLLGVMQRVAERAVARYSNGPLDGDELLQQDGEIHLGDPFNSSLEDHSLP